MKFALLTANNGFKEINKARFDVPNSTRTISVDDEISNDELKKLGLYRIKEMPELTPGLFEKVSRDGRVVDEENRTVHWVTSIKRHTNEKILSILAKELAGLKNKKTENGFVIGDEKTTVLNVTFNGDMDFKLSCLESSFDSQTRPVFFETAKDQFIEFESVDDVSLFLMELRTIQSRWDNLLCTMRMKLKSLNDIETPISSVDEDELSELRTEALALLGEVS